MEQKLNTSCTKPNCNCIEIAEQKNGGNPVKSYECLSPYPMIFEKWNASAELKAFQEWVIRGGYRVTPFETFMKETKKQYFERKSNNGQVSLFAFT